MILLGTTAPISLGFLRGFPEYLNSCGWTVHIVSSGGPELDEYKGAMAATIHRIEMKRNPQPLSDAKALIKWIRLLGHVRPDIVVVGTPKAAMLSMIAAALTMVPIRIYHLWGLRVETTKGFLRAILLATEWATCLSATRVLLVSPSLGQAVLRARLAPRRKLDLIGPGSSNGIDLEYFDPSQPAQESIDALTRSLAIDEGDFVVGYVGRIHPDKGIDYLVEAMSLLTQRVSTNTQSDPPVLKLLVVGDLDHHNYRPFATAQFPVNIVGPVKDTRPYYRLMNALCLPTLREGLPNAPLEAAAMGVPVVTTTATGARDSLRDGFTGLLVPTHDAQALAHALEQLIANPNAAHLMGEQGRQWAKRFERSEIWRLQEIYFTSLIESGAKVGRW